jgi:protein TonB
VDAKEKEEEIVEPLEPEIPEVQKSIQFLEPKVSNDLTETEIPSQEEMENTNASSVTSEGNSDFGATQVIVEKKEEPVEVKKEPEIFEVVEEPAEYPGGINEMRKYLAENINYPDIAREMGYQGKCYLRFVVSENGYISNVVVKKGVPDCPECDKEAIRVVKSMKQWKPAKNNGKPVNSYYTLPVSFKLG